MIDEADLLAQNEPLLQALRNLLMDVQGLALIIAGTEQMFPAIRDVFSPVPRQFVRIPVESFRTWQATQRAITRRLILAGQDWATPNSFVCREIHRITGGRPYEVILLSHFAFREATRHRQRLPMRLTASVLEAVAHQLRQQDPTLHNAIDRLRNLQGGQAAQLRNALGLQGVTLKQIGLAKLAFSISPDADHLREAAAPVVEVLEALASTEFVRVTDGTVEVAAQPFERAFLNYWLLSADESDEEEDGNGPTLLHPDGEIRTKTDVLFKERISSALGDVQPAQIFSTSMSFGGSFADPDAPLLWEDQPYGEYLARIDVGLEFVSDWSCHLWLPRSPSTEQDTELLEVEIARVLSASSDLLAQYDVKLGDVSVSAVDHARLEQLEREVAAREDPAQEKKLEVVDAFIEGHSGYQQQVGGAAEELLAMVETGQTIRWEELNDFAFMAFGIGRLDLYDRLSDLAMAENEHPVTLMTRALRVAAEGETPRALEMLDEAESELERVEGAEWLGNAVMYSPAFLLRGQGQPQFQDLIRDVDVRALLPVYRLVMAGGSEGEQAHAALETLADTEPSKWLLLVAAEAAAAEGDREAEGRLRERAADLDVANGA